MRILGHLVAFAMRALFLEIRINLVIGVGGAYLSDIRMGKKDCVFEILTRVNFLCLGT